MSGKRPLPDFGYNPDTNDIESLYDQLERLVDSLDADITDFDKEPVHGRIYTADSIDYRRGQGHLQSTSSPSYWGGVWSLTCCKYDMRREHFYDYFREEESGALRPTQPLFIFTCSGKMGSDRPDWAAEKKRWLASVALVTHAFKGMDDYGRFLLDQGEESWKPRISTQNKTTAPDWAIEHGDCHAIMDGGEIVGIDSPHPDHDHVSSSGTAACGCNRRVQSEYAHAYHDDNDKSILKFASTLDYWMSWNEPHFYWTRGNGRSRWGGGESKLAYNRGEINQQGDTVLAELRTIF